MVGRDPRKVRFVGDMPHGWVASDFIAAVIDLFAYEREADHALVLAAGIPLEWFEASGVAIENLRTSYGLLSYSIRKNRDGLVLQLRSPSPLPPGGLVFLWPDGQELPRFTWVNGEPVRWEGSELRIRGQGTEDRGQKKTKFGAAQTARD